MSLDNLREGYSRVDQTVDPQAMVEHMDKLRAHDPFRAVKQENFRLLGVQPGARILDVGSGPGDDARELAEMVGPDGMAVGVDSSETMVAEAQKRAQETGLSVEYHVMDATQLDFPNNSFDGARADRVLQHVNDPTRTLAEMVRVTKPGGTVAISDTDWGMMAIDISNAALRQWFPTQMTRHIRNAVIGRQLFRLFHDAGLQDIQVIPHVIQTRQIMSPPGMPPQEFLNQLLQAAQAEGVITQEQGNDVLAEVDARSQAGTFFGALVMFTVAGKKEMRNEE